MKLTTARPNDRDDRVSAEKSHTADSGSMYSVIILSCVSTLGACQYNGGRARQTQTSPATTGRRPPLTICSAQALVSRGITRCVHRMGPINKTIIVSFVMLHGQPNTKVRLSSTEATQPPANSEDNGQLTDL